MHSLNDGNGVQVVNSGVELATVRGFLQHQGHAMTYTNFIHNGNACILCFLVELEHGR